MNNTLKNIVKQSIDIHVHIGPEVLPRKYNIQSLIKKQAGKISGCVIKNHFYPTTPFLKAMQKKSKIQLFGSVVLNNSMGGMNTEAIYGTSLVTDKTFFVWLPTINSANFLKKSNYEIAPEWAQGEKIQVRIAQEIRPVLIAKQGKLLPETIDVLKMIKKFDAVLATGHISWQESVLIVNKALEIGLNRIVITHPIYQKIAMPITIQKQLSKKGCYIEQCYSMYGIDNISIKEIANQIRRIGTDFIILSSDVGQVSSPSPSNALYKFGLLLLKEGLSEEDLRQMLVINPRRLLNIK